MAKQKEVPVNHYDILSRRPRGFHLPVAEVPGEAVAAEAEQPPAEKPAGDAAAQEDATPTKTKAK